MNYFLTAKKAGVSTSKKIILVVCDLLFIFISMAAAYVIRSRFVYFIFTDLYLVYCLPYVFLFRLVVNFVFDFYSLDLRFMTIRDILKISLMSLIPTIGFSFIRLVSPIEVLRIPFSIIFAEYFFTFLFISISRSIINTFLKRRNRNDRSFQYGKNALLLLNMQFTERSHSPLLTGNHLSVIGILTENRLLWGSDFRNIRVIGGWQELRDLIINHNQNLMVVIDETLEETDKIRLYAEIIDSGAYPAFLSNGHLHFPSLSDLFEQRRTFVDFIPVEIEEWIKTKSFTIIGDTFGQYAELTEYFKNRSVPVEIKYDLNGTFSSDGSLLLDCRLMAAYEAGQSTPELVNSLVDSYRRFADSAPWSDCVLVVPKRISHPHLTELTTPMKLSVLMTNDYFQTDLQFVLYSSNATFFDRAPEVLAAAFKVLYCNRENSRRNYLFCSMNFIDISKLKTDARLSFLFPLSLASGRNQETDSPSLGPGTAPTAFTGLSYFEKG